MEAHLHEEFKLWSFVVLCQIKSRMQGGKKEKSNMKKFKRTATIGHILSTYWSPFDVYYMCFEAQEVRSLTLQTVHESELKQSSYGCLKTTTSSCVKISQPKAHFAAAKWAAKWNPLGKFRSCETHLWHMSAISQSMPPSSQLRTTLRNHLQVVKSQIQLAKSKFKLEKWTIQHAKSTYAISDICYRLS